MSGNVDVSNYVQLVVAATIYLGVEQPESALRVLHPSDHLECVALRLQALLSIHRPDLAKKELKVMQEKDEDALAEAIEKDPNNPETLVNMIVLAQHQGKQPEVSNRYLSQLKDMDPHHSFVVKLGQKEA